MSTEDSNRSLKLPSQELDAWALQRLKKITGL